MADRDNGISRSAHHLPALWKSKEPILSEKKVVCSAFEMSFSSTDEKFPLDKADSATAAQPRR